MEKKKKIDKINNDLLENLQTIKQLMEGYNDMKCDGSKDDVLFYSDMIIDSYLKVSQLFVQLHNEVVDKHTSTIAN